MCCAGFEGALHYFLSRDDFSDQGNDRLFGDVVGDLSLTARLLSTITGGAHTLRRSGQR